MNKTKRFLLIVIIIFTIILMIGCDIKEDASISIVEKIDTPEGAIEENDSFSKWNWQNYLLERDYNRNTLDIKTPNEYEIHIEFSPTDKKYIGRQSVKYINNEDVSLDEIYFHIYPNAFKEKYTTPYSLDSYIGDFNIGSINMIKVMVEDKNADYTIFGDDSTLLKIPMEKPLDPEKAVKIYMEYEVILPNAEERFGYGNSTFQIGNGYPIAAVYDNKKWNLDPYYSMGDPFYSDISNYSVSIKAPKEYTIACSGKILSEEILGEDKVWNVEAKLMRDFAWAASKDFIIEEKLVDEVLVKNYLLPNDERINNQAAELAYKAVEIYNKIFGKYPYEVLSVVTADATGMEYPGMVFVWKSHKLNNKSLESTIIHEIAHQWWYGAVGNNQIDEPWLDESFAIYAQKLFYDELYSEAEGEKYYNEKIVSNYQNRIGDNIEKELILTPTYKFEDWNEYTALLHKGAMFLYEIEKDLGKDKFYDILSNYYDRYKYSIATTKDFIDICEELSGKKYEEAVNKWFFGNE